MPRNSSHTQARNKDIRKRFSFHRKKNPKWTLIAVIETVSIEFYLEPSTVGKILKTAGEEVPVTETIIKYTKTQQYA